MSHQRLQARVPSARFLVAGYLTRHVLRWHKLSKDGSGKCDAHKTGVASDVIWGGVFEIRADEKHFLDKAEGLGTGYSEKLADICCPPDVHDLPTPPASPGQHIKATLYAAIPTDPTVKPYNWYRNFVVSGARQCRLPAPYLAMLEMVNAIEDPDRARDQMNRAILQDGCTTTV